jgi:predicted ATPase/class 3 adenylate cyclase
MALARVLCPSLVGREAELSSLEDALLAALRGDGGVVIIGGEAGMGKTRLVSELSARAVRLRCVVMSGACSEAELSLPYLPFLEAIGNRLTMLDVVALRDRLGSAAEELAQLFPQLGRPANSGNDPVAAKLRLFEAMLLMLRDAARERALLLVLEDLQWADPATRELLDYMTRRLRSTNVLIVATYRMDEMHRKHPLVPTIQGWRRSGQAEFIELKPMPATSIASMVCTIFDERQVSDEFRDYLFERSEGNPFVLEEMLRDAVDRGDIYRTDTGWDRKAITEMRMPNTVRATILHRLERLRPEEVEVLSAASVVGRSADLETLAAVTGKDQAAVMAALESCVSFQLLEEDEHRSGRYRFRHALTREAVYDDMIVPRRQQLHGRVAEVLQARPDHAAVDLAHHLLSAGRYEQAVGVCIEAAEDALAAHAYRDAADLFERAAPHLKDHVERGRLLCRAGEAHWYNTEPQAARRLLEEGIADLESAGLTVEAASHRLLLGRCFWELNRPDLARNQFLKARDVLETAGPSEALAIAYIRLAGLAIFDMGRGEGLVEAKRAAEIAEQAGSSLALAWSWSFMALAEIGLGEVELGFKHLDKSFNAAVAGDFYFQKGNAAFNAAWTAVHLGLGRLADTWADRLAKHWVGRPESWPIYIEGLITLQRGEVERAIELFTASTARSREASNEKNVWRSRVALAQALAEAGRADEAQAELPALSTRVEGQDAVYDGAARVRTRLAAGDAEGAFRAAETVPPAMCDMASPADAVSEGARGHAAWLRDFMTAVPARGEVLTSPRLSAAWGRLALYEGNLDDALDKLRAADASFSDGGLRLDVWHVGRSLAEAEARSGDQDAARRRLTTIVDEAEAGGARLAARLARDTAAEFGLELPTHVPEPVDQPVTDRVTTGERLVTVLFADVRGYTEMSGAAAPGDMADRIASLQRWATQEVVRRNGLVDKFAGDAVMATFNVSGQSVDHAVQALQAGIAIIDKAALAGLPVAVGIAVGPAVVGNLAPSANVSVLGEVTNLASRLQATASAGEVLLSDEAHRRVQGWLLDRGTSVERLELDLKGFSEPIVAYRVGAAAEAGITA